MFVLETQVPKVDDEFWWEVRTSKTRRGVLNTAQKIASERREQRWTVHNRLDKDGTFTVGTTYHEDEWTQYFRIREEE